MLPVMHFYQCSNANLAIHSNCRIYSWNFGLLHYCSLYRLHPTLVALLLPHLHGHYHVRSQL